MTVILVWIISIVVAIMAVIVVAILIMAIGLFVSAFLQHCRRIREVSELPYRGLRSKQGTNDLSRWRQYGGTLDRPEPPGGAA